jgi:ATP-binding cassette, subfamily C, bacterial CydD
VPPARSDISNAVRLLLSAPGARLRLATVVALHVLTRLTIVALAFGVALRGRDTVLATTAALAALFAIRGALRATLSRHARAAIARSAVQALLGGYVLADRGVEDLTVTVHEGLYLGQQLADQLPALIGDLAAAPFVAAALALEAPPRVLAIGAIALLVGSVGVVGARAWTVPLIAATQQALQPIYDALGHAVNGRLEIVSAGRDDGFRADVDEQIARWQRVATRSEWGTALAGRAPAAAAVLLVGIAVAIDASLRGSLEHAAIGAAAIAASTVPTFLGVAKGAIDTLRTTVRLRPFFALLHAEPAPAGAPTGTPLPRWPAPIEWRSVSFAYPSPRAPGQRLALRDVSFPWHPGQVLVLHGRNGSGKSTLLRLLLALARPLSGSITVGGTDLFELDLDAWRRNIAFLPQRPYVPERATVREAIRLLVRDASDDEMRANLARAGVWTALAAHAPDPLDTRVGTLSVGERQRLALARMLCHPSSVVLLDEPDANLDAEGIALVAKLVRELAQDRMVAIAAHTPDLVRQGDVVVEMVEGAPLPPAPVVTR